MIMSSRHPEANQLRSINRTGVSRCSCCAQDLLSPKEFLSIYPPPAVIIPFRYYCRNPPLRSPHPTPHNFHELITYLFIYLFSNNKPRFYRYFNCFFLSLSLFLFCLVVIAVKRTYSFARLRESVAAQWLFIKSFLFFSFSYRVKYTARYIFVERRHTHKSVVAAEDIQTQPLSSAPHALHRTRVSGRGGDSAERGRARVWHQLILHGH